MPPCPASNTDQERIVAVLAAEAHVPVAEVATIYEAERAALALGARITAYLPIFAIRRVQEILRQRAEAPRSPPIASPLAGAV